MKQRFSSSVSTYPFLTFSPSQVVGLNGKSHIYPIMKGLQGFWDEFGLQIVVFGGFNGSFPVNRVFQPCPQMGAPGPAAEGIIPLLVGGPTALEPTPYKKDTQTEESHRHNTGEKGGLAKRWGCT